MVPLFKIASPFDMYIPVEGTPNSVEFAATEGGNLCPVSHL